MVGLTVVAVGVVVATGGAAYPAASAGVSLGLGNAVASGSSTAAAVAASAGQGAVVGAVTGASTGCVAGAGTGAVAGSAAAAATTSTGAGAAGLTGGILAGPVGWLVLGTSEEPATSAYTFDCWKRVVHDTTPEPSNGRLLREIVADPRVKKVIECGDKSPFPEIILENIWDEIFRIEYVMLPSNKLAAHAVLLSA